jgi:hypothetical protein
MNSPSSARCDWAIRSRSSSSRFDSSSAVCAAVSRPGMPRNS